jgi:hypothetical protein
MRELRKVKLHSVRLGQNGKCGLPKVVSRKEASMRNVTFSDIARIRHPAGRQGADVGAQRVAALAVTMVLGLPVLGFAVHLAAPATPLAYIVLPGLAGGLLPLVRGLPARLDVSTRFCACHLVGTLDDAMEKLGYVPAERGPGAVRYRMRARRWGWPGRDVAVTVREHALELTGPASALRALRRRMDR